MARVDKKIGNYIHWSDKGYSTFGIAQDDKTKGERNDFNKALISQKNRIKKQRLALKSGITKKEAKRIESYFKGLFEASKHNYNADLAKKQEENHQYMTKWLEDTFGKALQNIDNIWEKGKIESYANNIGKINADRGYGKDLNYWSPKAIENKMKQIDALLNSGMLENEKAQKLSQEIEELKNDYNEAVQIVQSVTQELLFKDGRTYTPGEKHVGQKYLPKDDSKKLVKKINNLIIEYASSINTNFQQGTMFEELIKVVLVNAQNTGELGLADAIEAMNQTLRDKGNLVTGMDKSAPNIQLKKYFSGNFYKPINNSHYREKNGNVILEHSASQNKVDVTVKWKTNAGNEILLPISAKNIQSSGQIKILSDSSLLFLIQDENADFINHYLNLVSVNSTSNVLNLTDNKQEAINTLRLTLLYKAMAGSQLKGMQASIFISNLRGQVYVHRITDVIDSITDQNTMQLKTTGIRGLNDEQIGDFVKANSWEGKKDILDDQSAQMRITHLLNHIHATKISVAISQSIVKNAN